MSKRALLHVDDNNDDLFLFSKACSQAAVSFELQSLESGKLALEYLQGLGPYANRAIYPFPDLLLLDLKMPPPAGFDVLRSIRENANLKHLAVCIFTSSFQYEDIQKASAQGANSFLTKPATLGKLAAIASALDQCLAQSPPQFEPLKQLAEFRQ
jgi:CheY-like chemotaxis protein